MYFLQTIKLPDESSDNPENLYFRIESDKSSFLNRDGCLRAVPNTSSGNSVLEFSTFFGAISLTTWCGRAGLGEIGVVLEFSGACVVTFWHDEGNGLYKEILAERVTSEKERQSFLLKDLKGKSGILYPKIETSDPEFIFYGGQYWTPKPPKQEAMLAIVMTTFKREAYVQKNMALLSSEAILGSKDKIRLLIIDNGQTIDSLNVPDGVTIIPNLNYGGSGGFARGVLEAMKEKSFTHVLFCDDDIVIEPESVVRLHSLLGYLDQESVVGGGMLQLSKKEILYEIGGRYQQLGSIQYNKGMNVAKKEFLSQYDVPTGRNYFGWWFFACPIKIFEKEGLPLPLFVQIDDIEFGLRLSKKRYQLVTLLGVAVWHEEFDRKYTSYGGYYSIRNQLIAVWSNNLEASRLKLLKLTIKGLMPRVQTYRYESARYFLNGMEDALKGPEFLKRLDPPVFHSSLVKNQREKITGIASTPQILSKYNQPIEKSFGRKVRIFLSMITLNGHLLPSILMRRGDHISDSGYLVETLKSNRLAEIFLHPTVLYFDPSREQGIVCRINKSEGLAILFRYVRLALKLLWINSRISRDWREAHEELTSVGFWRTYLRL